VVKYLVKNAVANTWGEQAMTEETGEPEGPEPTGTPEEPAEPEEPLVEEEPEPAEEPEEIEPRAMLFRS
jgi:hypothetical protein